MISWVICYFPYSAPDQEIAIEKTLIVFWLYWHCLFTYSGILPTYDTLISPTHFCWNLEVHITFKIVVLPYRFSQLPAFQNLAFNFFSNIQVVWAYTDTDWKSDLSWCSPSSKVQFGFALAYLWSITSFWIVLCTFYHTG